jgi:hypothetical protein
MLKGDHMQSHVKRLTFLSSFCVLAYVVSCMPAYADTTFDLNIWNNTASNVPGGFVSVDVSPSFNSNSPGKTITITISNALAGGSIDKFFWNGSATIGANGWTTSNGTGFNADGFKPQFDNLITTTNNGAPGFSTITFSVETNRNDLGSCFAAHVNRPNSSANAFVTNCAPSVSTPEPTSLVLLGPGLLFLGLVRKRIPGKSRK